ncbi:MAG: FecR domain-containing protein, partial [Myxococcales bacterium]|nr:FecR domain-containing protein [Myxococcales bacterium]
METELCTEVAERLPEALEGELPAELAEHVEGCDVCRDRLHDAAWVVSRVEKAGVDYEPPADLEARVLAAIDARRPAAGGETLLGAPHPDALGDAANADKPAPSVQEPAPARPLAPVGIVHTLRAHRRTGAALALAAAALVGTLALRNRGPLGTTAPAVSSKLKGSVATVIGEGNDEGLFVVDDKGAARALHKGEAVAPGARLRTTARARARIAFDDGTKLTLDRSTDVAIEPGKDRGLRLHGGALVLDTPTSETATTVSAPGGGVVTQGGRIALRALGGNTSVAVQKGKAKVGEAGHELTLGGGDGATLGAGPVAASAGGLAGAFGWSELGEHKEAGDAAAIPGLGVLRARLPGAKDDGDRALRLVRQAVHVRIAGDLARTEIDETFQSDDAQILEGIFKFPMPADAQIEKLALEVDGKLEEGAFVDKDRGKKIWAGVTYKAAPQPQIAPPREEWIWVPGPWKDPALLEWRAGGRMELKIYPIPAKGTRRVVLAYTQKVGKAAAGRRYVYSLPQFAEGTAPIDDFSVDVQVVGHDAPKGVQVLGYPATSTPTGGHTYAKKAFVPTGDLLVEYAKKDENALATTVAYKAGVEPAYVSLTLAPKLPRLPDGIARTHVIVVDASRSMIGERYARASALAARVIEEADPADRVAVLACDVHCVPWSVGPRAPGKPAADEVKTFLAGISPEGGSDLVSAVRTAAKLGKDPIRALRVIYLGDGAPTIGARSPSTLEQGVKSVIGDGQVTAVALGVDADLASLEAMARGGGGTVVPYTAGATLGSAALDVLEASYGVTLRDAVLTLPAGLDGISPQRLPALRAGSELTVVARMAASETSGSAVLKGTVAGKPFETSIPISVKASDDPGNAFVPRVWAAATIAELSRAPGEVEKTRIVELSKAFSVPSRFTSLIVLESPAMASAFGVAKTGSAAPLWTGEAAAKGDATAEPTDGLAGLGGVGAGADMAGPMGEAKAKASPMPAATATAAPPAKATTKPPSLGGGKKMDKGLSADDWGGGGGGGGGYWQKTRREWYRTVKFVPVAATSDTDLEAKITAARAAVVGAPDSRDKLESLFGLLARRPGLEEATSVMTTWTGRDPLDATAMLRRAELVARTGQRAQALRVLTGALEGKAEDF